MRVILVAILLFSLPAYSQRICVKTIYDSQIGVLEKGFNSGYQVEQYLAAAGLPAGNPWCASFAAWVYKECGNYDIPKYPGYVPNWFPSDRVIAVRDKVKLPPKPGDLIGIWFESKKRLAHIGFFDSQDEKYIYTVEGNTNEGGSREGDGVYRKKRIKRTVHSISSWAK